MAQGDILARLRGVIGETFEIDPGSVSEATKAADVPGWNSLDKLFLSSVSVKFHNNTVPDQSLIATISF